MRRRRGRGLSRRAHGRGLVGIRADGCYSMARLDDWNARAMEVIEVGMGWSGNDDERGGIWVRVRARSFAAVHADLWMTHVDWRLTDQRRLIPHSYYYQIPFNTINKRQFNAVFSATQSACFAI